MSELIMTRVLDASEENVFAAWTQAEHLQHWWAPQGFTLNIAKLELKPGGVFHYSQRTPDGQEMWGKFVYEEIAAPAKLIFINSFTNAEGDSIRTPFSPTWPLEIQNILTLENLDGKTLLTLRGEPIRASLEEVQAFDAMQPMIQQGFSGIFDQLAAYLAKL